MEAFAVLRDAVPQPVYMYERVTSTLDVARTLGEASPWTSVLARSQSGGRGQLRRQWESPEGNLYAALSLPRTEPFSGMACAPAAGFLLVSALRTLGLDVVMKWPNDIVLWREGEACKVGGILVEEHAGGIWAGVGLNIGSAPAAELLRADHALKASTVEKLLNFSASDASFYDITQLWLRLVKEAFSWYETNMAPGYAWWKAASEILLWRDSTVCLHDDDQIIHAKLLGIGPNGGIYLARDGRVEEFFSGSLRQSQ